MWPRLSGPCRNSLLIRGVNERINGLSDSWFDDEPRELLCECGDESCIEAILVSRADYEVAMEHPGHYLVNSITATRRVSPCS